MAEFHFVEDYERWVAHLIEAHPIDEAMSLAVGGDFERIGKIELDILKAAGLTSSMSIFDLGCGSGRLSYYLSRSGFEGEFLGTDVVQSLLDYAASRTPANYKFVMHRALSVPAEDASIDIACAFSVFTHLLHHESYLYMEDMLRVLKPGGKLVFSFLEFCSDDHWDYAFVPTVDAQRTGRPGHLNTFIERSVIEIWGRKLGFELERFIDGGESSGAAGPLGQATAILRRPTSK
ncbi:class I SAM-dependent methyltransferase [Paraburkholderia hospita]|uniref:class I SAM-dependent methyltransferase n=1 Tax=Paraburkholderia hospita TaxID=169430 RepID=UPI003ECC61EB